MADANEEAKEEREKNFSLQCGHATSIFSSREHLLQLIPGAVLMAGIVVKLSQRLLRNPRRPIRSKTALPRSNGNL